MRGVIKMEYPKPEYYEIEKDEHYNKFLKRFNMHGIKLRAKAIKENPDKLLSFNDKSLNAFYVWFTMQHTDMNQKQTCECFHITPRHYRDLANKPENIEEWEEMGTELYNKINEDNDVYIYREQQVELSEIDKALMQIGILNEPVKQGMTWDELTTEQQNKLTEINKFFEVGHGAGYFKNGCNPEDILPFYMSLPSEDRVKLGCNP